jgi:hypothetical protein
MYRSTSHSPVSSYPSINCHIHFTAAENRRRTCYYFSYKIVPTSYVRHLLNDVNVHVAVFCVITSYSDVVGYQRPPKRRYPTISPHGVATQKIATSIFIAVKTSMSVLLTDIILQSLRNEKRLRWAGHVTRMG